MKQLKPLSDINFNNSVLIIRIMKRYSILPLILLPLLFISCSKEPTLSEITLTNNNPVSLTKKGIEIDTEKFPSM